MSTLAQKVYWGHQDLTEAEIAQGWATGCNRYAWQDVVLTVSGEDGSRIRDLEAANARLRAQLAEVLGKFGEVATGSQMAAHVPHGIYEGWLTAAGIEAP